MKKSFLSALFAVPLMMSSVAQASSIHVFPLWDDTDTSVENSMIFTDGGVSMTVTAWTSSFNSDQDQLMPWTQVTGDDVGVFRNDDGLGVISSDSDGNDLDGGDSADAATDPDEGLLFVFSHEVSLLDIFMGDLDRTDDINFSLVDLTDPAAPVLLDSVIDEEAPSSDEFEVFEFAQDFTGTAFMLWVDGGNDDVEMLGIAVTKVPAPGTIFLLALGLLGLRATRKK